MTTETLFFRDRVIQNNDLELIFHKEIFWIYNEKPLPVVKYTLTNCKDISEVNFEAMDPYNDGFMIETRQEGNQYVFETTDLGDRKVKIICDKIEKEEYEYSSRDYVYLIKEILKQRDNMYENVMDLNRRMDDLNQFLSHELDVVTRKIKQAFWLTKKKKHFLLGKQEIIQKVLYTINKE